MKPFSHLPSLPATELLAGRTVPLSRAPAARLARPPSRAGFCFLVIGLCLFAGGCASSSLVRVQPWQRGTLADYTMRPDRDPLNTMLSEHVYFSRETASGGRAVGGSGCGCN